MKIVIIVFSLILGNLVHAGDFEYVGANKCKACHQKDEKGAQYSKWESSKHATAFETLLTEKALEIATKLELKTIPSESPECVGCHTTGYGLSGFDIKDAAFYTPAEDDKDGQKAAKLMENLKNVGCEACHGPGSKYKSKKTMEPIYTGTEKPETYGLVIPTEETCKQCHNEKSPMFKEFKFDEAYAKIAHNIPEVEPSK